MNVRCTLRLSFWKHPQAFDVVLCTSFAYTTGKEQLPLRRQVDDLLQTSTLGARRELE